MAVGIASNYEQTQVLSGRLANINYYLRLTTETSSPGYGAALGGGCTELATANGYPVHGIELPKGVGAGYWALCFEFTITALSGSSVIMPGDTYTDSNSKTWTVYKTVNSGTGTTLIAYNGLFAPPSSGTLTKATSPLGPATVSYSAASQDSRIYSYPEQQFTWSGSISNVNSWILTDSTDTDASMCLWAALDRQGSVGAGDTTSVFVQYAIKDQNE